MAKFCEICGKPSGMYPLCTEHSLLIDKGKIIKCDNCGKWHYTNKPCKCQITKRTNQQTERNNDSYDTPTENLSIVKDIESIDFRKRFPCDNRCQDGHYVRSNEEVIIDDYLYSTAKLIHSYEEKFRLTEQDKKICLKAGKNYDCFYPDFYIPELNLYIEYFGRNDEQYNQKMDLKIKIFQMRKDINFAYLTHEDNKILTERLEDIIHKYRQKKK